MLLELEVAQAWHHQSLESFRALPQSQRLLMLAHAEHKAKFCPGCGQAKAEAYHPDMGGYYEVEEFECAGCATLVEDGKRQKEHDPARKVYLVNTRDLATEPLPAWPGSG